MIPKKIYNKLSLDEKITLLQYERSKIKLINSFRFYKELDKKSATPRNVYLSNVLGFDVTRFASTEYKAGSKMDMLNSKYGLCNILANFNNVIYNNIWVNDSAVVIDNKLVSKIDRELVDIWNFYTTDQYEYIKLDIRYNGEPVYKRVGVVNND